MAILALNWVVFPGLLAISLCLLTAYALPDLIMQEYLKGSGCSSPLHAIIIFTGMLITYANLRGILFGYGD